MDKIESVELWASLPVVMALVCLLHSFAMEPRTARMEAMRSIAVCYSRRSLHLSLSQRERESMFLLYLRPFFLIHFPVMSLCRIKQRNGRVPGSSASLWQ